VTLQARHPEALDAPGEILIPVLHDLACEKVAAAVADGNLEDEIVFS
jgi:hypothetical protein